MYNGLAQMPNNIYRAVIYIRLSEADEGKSYESESESITNQRNLLMNFVKEKGFIFVGEYVDDGYSGTNFERPGFTKMIEDIKNKMANLVIVKDLSRLGRDHVMTGYYIENYFPENNIRFISLQENYDSAINQASNDSSTFIIACNDYYSRQNSIKIRSVLNDKRKKGKFIGSNPSYGYMKDPEEKGHLIPDPEYAPVVKKIFEMAASSVGLSDITSYLNDNKIKTPSSLKRKNPNSKMRYNEEWTISSVKKILKNRMYTGDMVQSVQTKVNYKSKKKKTLPKSNWDIVPNTHEPLIDKLTFERIQGNVKRTNKSISKRDKRLFENLLFCKECGNALTITYRKNQDYWTINCNKYARDPRRRLCEPHFMPYDKLEEALLEVVRTTCKDYINKIDSKVLSKEITDKNSSKDDNKEKIRYLENKIKEYISKIDMLYEDKFRGNISEATYKRLSQETERLLNKAELDLEKYKTTKNEGIKTKELEEYEKRIRELIDIKKPTRELLQTLIDKIEIDKDKNIYIYFNFSKLNSITENLDEFIKIEEIIKENGKTSKAV